MYQVIGYEQTFGFLEQVLANYWQGLPFLYVFGAGLILTLIFGRKRASSGMLVYALFLGLTIYNPLVLKFAVRSSSVSMVYYRLLWLLPVTSGIAYYAARAVSLGKYRVVKCMIAIAAFILIAYPLHAGNSLTDSFRMPVNIYKVPAEVITACDEIHRDYDGEEDPKVIFSDDIEIYVRQYDPSLHLAISENARLAYNGSQTNQVSKETRYYHFVEILMDGINTFNDVKIGQFRWAAKSLSLDYVVVPDWYKSSKNGWLEQAGGELVAQAGIYQIYRFRFS